MEPIMENRNNVIKKKKLNIFKRFSNKISSYFHKSKTSNLVTNGECNSSQSCLDDMPVTSKSHDDLNMKDKSKVKRKVFGDSLSIPKINDRCLSEGDLTREEGQYYSQGSSSKACTSGAYESNTNESPRIESNLESVSNNRKTHLFKNELALKLRGKNPAKDNESEHSKTPESPTGIGTGTSPSRNLFSDTRTPPSMSSLYHSSNSLLSGNTTNIYGTSDGESMSRSVIDSHDDIGIVVDLATPICKTTTAELLDSTAARQKIAASKARRVRPKAIVNVASDKVPLNDSGQFSPVRDKRDILEEISEEDCSVSPSLPASSEEQNIVTNTDIETKSEIATNPPSVDTASSSSIITLENASSPNKTDIIKSDLDIKEIPIVHLNETGDSSVIVSPNISTPSPLSSSISDEGKNRGFNLHKAKFQLDNNKPNPEKAEPKFPVKLRPTGLNNFNKTTEKPKDLKTENPDSSNHSEKSLIHKDKQHSSDPPKIHHYIPYRPSRDNKSHASLLPATTDCIPSTDATKDSHIAQNATPGSHVDKRSSRVLNMAKNFEGLPCSDSH